MASASTWERWFCAGRDAYDLMIADRSAASLNKTMNGSLVEANELLRRSMRMFPSIPSDAIQCFATPDREDVGWLSEALRNEHTRDFVVSLANTVGRAPE